ncbi:MAG TPA: putative baseplate assembly protein [Dokdonella sp.]
MTGVTPGASDDERGADSLRVTLDRSGDFSTYTLRVFDAATGAPPAGIDPRYAEIDFSFKIGCASDFDCAAAAPCTSAVAAPPNIDYLAKDYESFRQLLLDRLATTMPHWRERHVPDLGITLVELLAYAADQLSAYQDAVATEAYLDTARTRISLRRHARLVDYRLHEGCNARAWLAIECIGRCTLPADAYFVTANDDIAALGGARERRDSALAGISARDYEVFEQACAAAAGTPLADAYNRISFHTWGDQDCCLRKGATRATLVDPSPAAATTEAGADAKKGTAVAVPALPPLAPGDVLIFEEVLGPRTGDPADADGTHRQAVRLTRVDYTRDALLDTAIIEIEWAAEDALRFVLCVSAQLPAPDCRRIGDISVARGNVILVDHGRWVRGETLGCVGTAASDSECGCDGAIAESREYAAPFAPTLVNAPLVYAQAPACAAAAATLLSQDPRAALPCIAIAATRAAAAETWSARADLLASDADARDVVVETDDDGRGHLRFGDGRCGRAPTPGSCFSAAYRVGIAVAGNVARETIAYVVFRANVVDGAELKPRNPLPASGGIAPETLAAARLAAPRAFRAQLERAITADDYAQLAEAEPALQRAHAHLAWTGSWYEADVAIDPLGSEDAPAALCRRVERRIECFRRAGHDLAVQAARYVPLAIRLHVCVKPDYLAGQVFAAVLDVLGSGLRADGTPAFFHPDRLSFGTDVYASDLVAAAQAIEGVQNVEMLELRRLDRPRLRGPVPDALDLAAWEIARVDNDPSFPEHGMLKLETGGGR